MVKQRKDEKRSRKAVFGFVALFAAVAVIVGVGYAYFSDVITGEGTATAGTLDINGDFALYQKDDTGAYVAQNPITNLNPGDIIPVTVDVENAGNKSAWLRSCVMIDPASTIITGVMSSPTPIRVYAGDTTDAAIIDGTAQPLTATTFNPAITVGGVSYTAGYCSSGTQVIDGTGTGAETDDPTGDTIVSENTLATTSAAPTLKVYFDKAVGNDGQAKELDLAMVVQALQYRNNNTNAPDATAWNTVVTTPFSLGSAT